jgi:hypothetical protein
MALAAMVDPESAMRNFERLTTIGARGRYGFYEALDYTRSRLPEGAQVATVRAYMAHHQGMSIVAIANVLLDGKMRGRFHAEPSIQATELLLQERAPRDVSADEFASRLVKRTADLRVGDPRKDGDDVALACLIGLPQAKAAKTLIDDAVAQGATLLIGGELDGTFMRVHCAGPRR